MRKMSKYQRRIFQIPTIFILLAITSFGRQIQIKPNIDLPRHNYNYLPSTSSICQKNKTNIFKFPEVKFEISGSFYGYFDSIYQDQLYNKAAYTSDLSQYCYLYWTSTSVRSTGTINFQQDFQVIKYYLYDRTKDSLLYILGDNSILYRYIVTQNQIKNDANFTVPESISQLMNRQSKSNVQMIVIKQKLFLFNNQSMHVLHQNDGHGTFVQVDGYVRMERLVDVGIAYKNEVNTTTSSISEFQVWVCEEKGIQIYEIIDQNYKISTKLIHSKKSITNDTILAVYYERLIQTFYFTTSNSLYKHKRPSSPQSGAPIEPETHWYKINGTCRSINKIKQTLYLSCQYQRVSYIAQFQVKQDDVIINRFYDQFFVDGIRDVESLGFDRIALIGDQEAVIIGQGVNRNILLELNNKGETQLKQNVYSFGMIDVFYLPQFSTPSRTVVLSVGFDSLQLVKVQFQPPQLQCIFPPVLQNSVVSILGVFNTTHCPYSIGDPYSLGGTYLVCQSFYPIKLDLKTKQYEEKTANFIFFVLMLMAVVFVLLFAGCGVKIRNKANAIIQSAHRQINKIKRQRQSSELKKI